MNKLCIELLKVEDFFCLPCAKETNDTARRKVLDCQRRKDADNLYTSYSTMRGFQAFVAKDVGDNFTEFCHRPTTSISSPMVASRRYNEDMIERFLVHFWEVLKALAVELSNTTSRIGSRSRDHQLILLFISFLTTLICLLKTNQPGTVLIGLSVSILINEVAWHMTWWISKTFLQWVPIPIFFYTESLFDVLQWPKHFFTTQFAQSAFSLFVFC